MPKEKGKIAVGTKGVTVKDAKEIIPLDDAYEFKKQYMYLFVAKPQSQIIGGNRGMNPETIAKLRTLLNSNGIRGVFIVADMDTFRVYELKPEDIK
jgi:hypothetical protein